MITDLKTTFIDETADLGAATALQVGNIIDLGAAADFAPGETVRAHIVIKTAYNKATSEKWDLASCATVGGTYVVTASTGTVVIADAPAGKEFILNAGKLNRFVKLLRTEVGTASDAGGVVSAFLVIK